MEELSINLTLGISNNLFFIGNNNFSKKLTKHEVGPVENGLIVISIQINTYLHALELVIPIVGVSGIPKGVHQGLD